MRAARFVLWQLMTLMVGISGCAFGDRHVKLNYPPPVSADEPALTPAPAKSLTIVIARFKDERGNKNVGEVRDGFGMHTADVVTDADLTTWVMTALAHELKAAGYAFQWGTATPSSERIQLSGDVLEAYSRALLTYEAEVSFFVELDVDGKSVMHKLFTGTAGAGLNWAGTEASYEESLSLALRNAVAQFLTELRPALRAIGPPPPPLPAAPATAPVAPPFAKAAS
jgi:hypothetical protein